MPRKKPSAARDRFGLLPAVPVQFVEMLADLLNTPSPGKDEPSAEARAHVNKLRLIVKRANARARKVKPRTNRQTAGKKAR